MPQESDLADYHWLVGATGREFLRQAAQEFAASDLAVLGQLAKLRKSLSVERTRLVVQQVELRRRASAKFSEADKMFFTPQGLQQATDSVVADFKAQRFYEGKPVADLCCGIGGDLISLCRRGSGTQHTEGDSAGEIIEVGTVGVDRDPVSALFALANCRAASLLNTPQNDNEESTEHHGAVRVHAMDVEAFPLEEVAAWHMDPDRRPEGRRTTRVELHSPSADTMQELLTRQPNAAIKLAPAAVLPDDWADRAELEWISSRRECRQLVVWFGDLARHPGQRAASVLGKSASDYRTVVGDVCDEAEYLSQATEQVDRFLMEPDPAVLAAGLSCALAQQNNVKPVSAKSAYLTGATATDDPALACFEVTDVLPYKVKQLKALLRERRIGRLEVKKRGVPFDPDQVRRELRVPGDHVATLLITPIEGKPTAILARRVARQG